jgi:transcriptional regulator with XRE-family HTH domain
MSDIEQVQSSALAERLKQARKLSGLSQDHVARVLGVPRPSVSQMEWGKRRVSSSELARMAEIYEVSVAWLLAMDDQNPRLERAARELSSLRPDDLERLLALLAAMRHGAQSAGGGR